MSTPSRVAPRRQFWLEHIEACAESSKSVKGYADAHGLSAASFYAARSRYKQAASRAVERSVDNGDHRRAPRFVRVEPSALPRGPRIECRTRLANGAMLELSVDVKDLEATLRAIAAVT